MFELSELHSIKKNKYSPCYTYNYYEQTAAAAAAAAVAAATTVAIGFPFLSLNKLTRNFQPLQFHVSTS